PWRWVGITGHCRRQDTSSEDGRICFHCGARGEKSASVFSLTMESYWSIESSSVLALGHTSRCCRIAYSRTPGIRESSGCQLSTVTPFSEDTHTPSGVLR